jgi:hypothetical protein
MKTVEKSESPAVIAIGRRKVGEAGSRWGGLGVDWERLGASQDGH